MNAGPESFDRDVCVVGGGGHVGLPLALMFAEGGLRTVIYDINEHTVETIRSGQMPFKERGADEILPVVLKSGFLEVESTPDKVSSCRLVVLIVGTVRDMIGRSLRSLIDEGMIRVDRGRIVLLDRAALEAEAQN